MKKIILSITLFLAMLFGFGLSTLYAQPDSTNEEETLPMVQHYGLLKLEIDGGESLTILDGKFLDKNVWLISMRPGLHTLAVQRKGYKTYEKHFEISDDDRLSFSISLEKDNDENAERVSQH